MNNLQRHKTNTRTTLMQVINLPKLQFLLVRLNIWHGPASCRLLRRLHAGSKAAHIGLVSPHVQFSTSCQKCALSDLILSLIPHISTTDQCLISVPLTSAHHAGSVHCTTSARQLNFLTADISARASYRHIRPKICFGLFPQVFSIEY